MKKFLNPNPQIKSTLIYIFWVIFIVISIFFLVSNYQNDKKKYEMEEIKRKKMEREENERERRESDESEFEDREEREYWESEEYWGEEGIEKEVY